MGIYKKAIRGCGWPNCFLGVSDGSAVCAVDQSNRLTAGAGRVGSKGRCGGTLGNAVGNCPCNCVCAVGVCRYVGEIGDAGDLVIAACAVQEGHDLAASADCIRVKGGLGSALGDALLDCPQDCVVVYAVLAYVGERILQTIDAGRACGAIQEGYDLRTGAAVVDAEGVGGYAVCDLVINCPEDRVVVGAAGLDILERILGRSGVGIDGGELIDGDDRVDGAVIESDLIILGVSCLALLVGVDDEGEGVTFLNGVEVGLEVDGVVVVFADLQSDLGIGRGGVVACAGVAQIHPAASDDLVADVACLELRVVVVAQTAAHPCAVFGEILGNIAALGVECLEGLAFGSDVNEHCADHERVAVDKIGCVGQGNSHAAACCACNVVVVIKRAEVKLGRNCVVVIDAAARSVGSVVVINACREVNGNRALDDRVGLDGHGVHCADCGVACGELISPVAAGDAEGGVVAVDGGAAGLAGGKGHALCGLPAVVGVPYGSVVAVLGGDCRHVLCAVLNAAQIVAEPTVKDIVVAFAVNVELEVSGRVARCEVSVLVEQELYVYAGLLVCLIHQVKFLGADVVVVEAVNYESRALDVLCVKSVVTGLPVLGVVAVGGELILLDLVQVVAVLLGDGSVIGRIEVAAVAVPCEHLGIACRPCAGGNTLRVGVLIPACDACYGNDGLETGNAGGGQTELGGACV